MNNKPKSNRAGDTKKVSQMDICQTPPHAIEPLLPYLDNHWIIWESAAGPEHLLADALENEGFFVIATDLLYSESFNFFDYEPGTYDIQITNMPFSIKYEWLQRSFALGKRFALLAPYETTFAEKFQRLFKQYNGKPWHIEVLSPERRINYKMPNMGWGITEYDAIKGKMIKRGDSAQMPTAWITWGLEVHQTKNIDDVLFTFYVPMRKVKYDENNKEITK